MSKLEITMIVVLSAMGILWIICCVIFPNHLTLASIIIAWLTFAIFLGLYIIVKIRERKWKWIIDTLVAKLKDKI